MMQTMKAGARALRNSDYVNPDTKSQLLQEIMRCWEQNAKVLMILFPFLATRGQASFDGAGYILGKDFTEIPKLEERLKAMIVALPSYIVSRSEDDLFSQKMGPLLINQINNEHDELKKHMLILLLIRQRPRDWKAQIEKYISSITKNSFFLMNIYLILQGEYSYSYASSQTLKDIEYLIKLAAAKHKSGNKLPGEKLIKRISDRVIPPREVDRNI